MKRIAFLGVTVSLAAGCGGQESLSVQAQREQFTAAIEQAAYSGSESTEIDGRIPCDFSLLTGNLAVIKTLGPDVVVVADKTTGEVPQYGLVDCIKNDDEEKVVRGLNGY